MPFSTWTPAKAGCSPISPFSSSSTWPGFFGFRIQDVYSEKNAILDLREGQFVTEPPPHGQALEGVLSYHTAQLLRVQRPEELQELPLNQETRRTPPAGLPGYFMPCMCPILAK